VILPEYHLTTGKFLTLTPSLGVIHCEYRQKLEALGYIYVAESLGISSTTFTQCALKATEVAEIMAKRPLRCSRSFNVTDFDINRKLIYAFI